MIRKLYNKIYYKQHRKILIDKQKKYIPNHIEKTNRYQKIYRQIHKETHQKYNKSYYRLNRKKLIKKTQEYYQTHKKAMNEWEKQYLKIKKGKDINFKIKCNLRCRIWLALKGINKSLTTRNLVGCSIERLRQYLQSKFEPGMSWSNYGKWHIDHIKPCASFDLRNKEDQYKCFNYKNLQPLWKLENLKKGKT